MTTYTLPSQNGKIALITGANRGLGYEMAEALAKAGAHVVLACRDRQKAEVAMARIRAIAPKASLESFEVDMADLESVRRFASAFLQRHASLDILIHNAAAIMVPQGVTCDGFENHLGINHFAPFLLTGLLLNALNAAPAARVVNIASLAHRLNKGLDCDDPGLKQRPYKELDAYGRSKVAALSFTHELNRRLQASGSRAIAVAAHPGYSGTNTDYGNFFIRLTTRLIAQSASTGALPILHAATAADVRGGDYYGPKGFKELRGLPTRVECSAESKDPTLAKRLWDLSERSTGLRYL